MAKKTIEISRNKYSKQIVEITEQAESKNRKGKPYKTSVTKHVKLTQEDRVQNKKDEENI